MVIFSKNPDIQAIKKDTLIFDFLCKIEKDIDKYEALYLSISKMHNQTLRTAQRFSLIESFETVLKKGKGELFTLPNEDIVLIYQAHCHEETLAALIKIHFLFRDDAVLQNSADLFQAEIAEIFKLNSQLNTLKDKINSIINNTSGKEKNASVLSGKNSSETKKLINQNKLRELSPLILSKMQKALSTMDFSSLIRRQSVCAIIGKSAPQIIFDEVFVSMAGLKDMLMPDVDLFSNPWLFLYLTEILDKRVLDNINRHDDGSLLSNFSLNLNVSTVLSDEFLEFDESINPTQRSSIVLELQLTDIFSDIKAFFLAKTFAQYRGYKICIDGINVEQLKYIDRENLQCDLMKIIWHPSFMDIIREDKHFTDYVNKAERSKLILCRVDDPQAVELGNSLGINLYQGRYIQRLLAAQPRKTIFTIK